MSAVVIWIPLSITVCILFVISGLAIKEYNASMSLNLPCHESAIAALLGLIIGGVVKYTLDDDMKFNSDLFFYLVLPPIIFSAGYSLKRKRFFRYGLSIATFGIVGTIINFAIISNAAFLLSNWLEIEELNWNSCMILGAVLSASDEVSAMALVRMKDYPHLGALIFGEGVLNDAISIVLFKALLSAHTSSDSSSDSSSATFSLSPLVITVSIQIILSSTIGVVCGLLNSLYLNKFPSTKHHPIHQTSLVLLFGLMAYSIAESIGVSGILALFVAAVTLAHYSWHSLSNSSQISTKLCLSSMSEIAEGFAFSYVGLSLWSFTHDSLHLSFSFIMLIVVVSSRFVTIFGLCALLSPFNQEFNLSVREKTAFCLGGIVRGCLCWAQILQIRGQSILLTTTLFIVMVSTVGCGLLLPTVMPLLIHKSEPLNQHSTNTDSSIITESDRATPMPHFSGVLTPISAIYVIWVYFDETVMKFYFGGSPADCTRAQIIKQIDGKSILEILKEPLVLNSSAEFSELKGIELEAQDDDFEEAYINNLVKYDEYFESVSVMTVSPRTPLARYGRQGTTGTPLPSRISPVSRSALRRDFDGAEEVDEADFYFQQLQEVIRCKDEVRQPNYYQQTP